MRYGSLFSGIGGFDGGFDAAGMTCVWQVEKDASALRVLTNHWPDVRKYNDVKEIKDGQLQPVDVICGGFPCQDLSVAGKRAGLAGERSGLWFEFHRIIESLKPRWVVIENVPGLLSSNKGADFAVILRGLVKCGYGVAWRILDAQYFGVAQRRRRVFIVASLGNGSCAQVLFESEGVCGDFEAGRKERARVAACLDGSPYADREAEHSRLIASTMKSNGDAHSGFEFGDGLTVFKKRGGFGWSESENVSPTLESEGGTHQGGPERVPMIAATLNSGGNSGGFRTEPGEHLVTFGWNKSQSQTMRVDSEVTEALQSSPTSNPAVAWHENKAGQLSASNTAKALRSGASHSYQGVGVRRLTPTECERLQGFPDGFTAGESDSTRYRMLGNAVCRNVAEWIGKRIMEASKS